MSTRRNFLTVLSMIGAGLFFSKPLKAKTFKKTMIVHQVFFWLHNPEKDLRAVMKGAESIGKLKSAKDYLVGVPAATEKRDVIDDSYHIALTVYFKSIADHDLYQEDPVHLQFIADHKEKWAKVQVYDFEV